MIQQLLPAHDSGVRTCVVTEAIDLDAVHELRYQVYCEERRFLDRGHFPERREYDRHDRQAVHFAAFDSTGQLAAAARLVRSTDELGFPFEDHDPLHTTVDLPQAHRAAEVSRLVINRRYRQPPGGGPLGSVVFGVYREMYRYSRAQDITHWYAAMERPLRRLLGRYGLMFQPLGPEIDFFGPVTVYGAELDALIQGMGARDPALRRWFLAD